MHRSIAISVYQKHSIAGLYTDKLLQKPCNDIPILSLGLAFKTLTKKRKYHKCEKKQNVPAANDYTTRSKGMLYCDNYSLMQTFGGPTGGVAYARHARG